MVGSHLFQQRSHLVQSFGVVVSAVKSHAKYFNDDLFQSNPAWIWLGGVLRCIYLTSNVLLFPHFGAIQTVVLQILGQILIGVRLLIRLVGLVHNQFLCSALRVIGVNYFDCQCGRCRCFADVLNKDVEAMDKGNQAKETHFY